MATALGLFPAQVLNTYLGTRLQTIEQAFSGAPERAYVSYAMVGVQICVGGVLSWIVVQRARSALEKTLSEARAADGPTAEANLAAAERTDRAARDECARVTVGSPTAPDAQSVRRSPPLDPAAGTKWLGGAPNNGLMANARVTGAVSLCMDAGADAADAVVGATQRPSSVSAVHDH